MPFGTPTLFDHLEPRPLRGYLSAALTGLDESDRTRLYAFNERLQAAGRRRGFHLYLPQQNSNPTDHDRPITAEDVYLLDRWRVAEADVVVLNAAAPSFGVGQEAEMACSMGVPIVAFCPQDCRVSRMMLGAPGLFVEDGVEPSIPSRSFIRYDDSGADQGLSDELIERILDKIEIVRRCTSAVVLPPSTSGVEFGARLQSLRQQAGLTQEDLARRTGLSLAYVRMLEATAQDVRRVVSLTPRATVAQAPLDRFHNPGLWVLRLLGAALGVPASALLSTGVVSGPTSAEAPPVLRNYAEEALLANFFVDRQLTFAEVQALQSQFGFVLSVEREGLHRDGDDASLMRRLHDAVVALRTGTDLAPDFDE